MTSKFAIKLVVSEISHTATEKDFRKAISPFASIIPNIKSEYGMFHTALVVGPWYLEW